MSEATTALAKASGRKPATMREKLEAMQGEFEKALPVHLKQNAVRYARSMMTLYNSNPKMASCSPVTVLSSAMTASALGLDLAPGLGQCYVIPYKDKGVMKAQFQLGYRGMLDLAMRSDKVRRVDAQIVYEKDEFEYAFGLDAKLNHKPSEEEDRGKPKYVYALAQFTNGGYVFDVWTWKRVIAHGDKFSKASYGPWKTDPEAMAKKTMLKAIWKFMPLSIELARASTQDEVVKENIDVENEEDIIDVEAVEVEDK